MLAAALRISSSRCLQSLGGGDSIPENSLANLRSEGLHHADVDAATKDLLEVAAQTADVEQVDRLRELDEHVDVAVGARLVAGDGAKEVQVLDLQRRQLGAM